MTFFKTNEAAMPTMKLTELNNVYGDIAKDLMNDIRYLRDGLFDIIKLDGSLVSGLITHGNTRDIILSITQLAKSLNMKIIAEFVDSEEKRELLHETGCDCYQGYLYSPAVFLQSK